MDWAAKYLPHRLTTYDRKSDTLGMSAFQRELCQRLDWKVTHRGTKTARLAPRKNAKSTISTIAYPLRESLEGREPYTLILSDALEKNAIPFLRDNIKREIEDNKELRHAYPDSCGRGAIWQDDKIELLNGACIEVSGIGQNIRGRLHRGQPPSLVIGDDLQGDKDIVSPTLRMNALRWFNGDVLNVGNPTTNFLMVGTAIHRESIIYSLANTPGWDSLTWKALVKPPEELTLWDDWERILHDGKPDAMDRARAFYDANKAAMDEGAEVLWPEQYPLYDLMLRMVSIGPAAFASEQQNNPTNPELNEWPEEYFDEVARPEFRWDKCDTEDGWPNDLHVRAMWLDPAKGRKDKLGDYSAIVLFGGSRSGAEYVKADLFRGSAEATVNLIISRAVKHVREFKPDVFGFEDVLFQSLYGKLLREALNAAGLDVTLLPSSDVTDKDVRIRRLTNPLAQRKLRFFRDKGTQLLVEQLRDFGPTAEKKDGPDALESARRTAWRWYKGKKKKNAEETQYEV